MTFIANCDSTNIHCYKQQQAEIGKNWLKLAKIICFFHPCYHPTKIIRDTLKNVQKIDLDLEMDTNILNTDCASVL